MGFWLFPPSMGWLRSSMLVMASETYTSVASPIQHAARRAFVLEYVARSTSRQRQHRSNATSCSLQLCRARHVQAQVPKDVADHRSLVRLPATEDGCRGASPRGRFLSVPVFSKTPQGARFERHLDGRAAVRTAVAGYGRGHLAGLGLRPVTRGALRAAGIRRLQGRPRALSHREHGTHLLRESRHRKTLTAVL